MTAALQGDGISLTATKLIGLRHLIARPESYADLAALPGGYLTKRKGTGQEIADVRLYVSGDDYRHLDRGTTARTGTLHVRQFQEERDRVVLLVADFRPSMFWGISNSFLSVAAAEALCLTGWRAVNDGARVALLAITPTDPLVVPVQGRTRAMLNVIGGLISAHSSALNTLQNGLVDAPDMSAGLERVSRICPVGSEIVIASAFEDPDEALRDRFAEIGQRRTPRLLFVTDMSARSLPRGRYPITLHNGTRTEAVLPGVSNSEVRTDINLLGYPTISVSAADSAEVKARKLMSHAVSTVVQ